MFRLGVDFGSDRFHQVETETVKGVSVQMVDSEAGIESDSDGGYPGFCFEQCIHYA